MPPSAKLTDVSERSACRRVAAETTAPVDEPIPAACAAALQRRPQIGGHSWLGPYYR